MCANASVTEVIHSLKFFIKKREIQSDVGLSKAHLPHLIKSNIARLKTIGRREIDVKTEPILHEKSICGASKCCNRI